MLFIQFDFFLNVNELHKIYMTEKKKKYSTYNYFKRLSNGYI